MRCCFGSITRPVKELKGFQKVNLKPGERKVISDGTDGPVVEIIRKGAKQETEAERQADAGADTEAPAADDTGE